jgi:5'-nucleotidase
MSTRRTFIRQLGGAGLLLAAGMHSTLSLAGQRQQRITILHTNDVHSRIDPFPLNDPKFPGLGGFARRAALIKKIRQEEEHVLLLDAGDIFQGTPYFNLFNGKPEIQLMSEMGYDASAIGNHDFDGGIDNLAVRAGEAAFPFLCANYDFSDTPLSGKTLPYKVFLKGKSKVGVFGLGIELSGLVDKRSYGNTRYSNPLLSAQKMSRLLLHDFKCDLVICLSHLGYKYDSDKVCDEFIATHTEGIDLIIGGHTHTFLDEPVQYNARDGKKILVAQTGWGGIRLGRIDFVIGQEDKQKTASTLKEKTFNYTIG